MSPTPYVSADPDVVTRTAFGALRFVDAVTGQSITDGLSVIARVRDKVISAIPSLHGVHLFHQLPGLTMASFWDGESEPKPSPHEFNIEVRDTARRFFPTAFKVRFPSWPEAIPICPEMPTLGMKVPLYSAPWRAQRGDFALIRGTLRVKYSKKPAAWALLRVYRAADDQATAVPLVEGVTAQDGQFLLMFPWGKPDTAALNGPKGLHWTMRIQAWYDLPCSQTPPAPEEYPDDDEKLPDLRSILKQQQATLLAKFGNNDDLLPQHELPPQQMIPGQALFLETTEIPPFVTTDKKILYLNI